MPAPVVMSSLWSAKASTSSSTTGRIASRPRSMIEWPPIFTTFSQGRSLMTGRPVTGRTRSRSRRVWRIRDEGTWMVSLFWMDMAGLLRMRSVGGDDGPDVLAVEGPLDEARLEAVDDLHRGDVAGMAQEIEHRALDDQVGQIHLNELVDGNPRDEGRLVVPLGVRRVEAVLVLHEDHGLAAVDLRHEVAAGVGAVGRDRALVGHVLPHVVGGHPGEDDGVALREEQREAAERGDADDRDPELCQQVAEHLGVLSGDRGPEVREHAGG